MLNPDGVFRGHYRTDQFGVNLNRVYLDPDHGLHPTIFATQRLLLYYHNNMEVSRSKRPIELRECRERQSERGSANRHVHEKRRDVREEISSQMAVQVEADSRTQMDSSHCISMTDLGDHVHKHVELTAHARSSPSLSCLRSSVTNHSQTTHHPGISSLSELQHPISLPTNSLRCQQDSGLAFYIDLHGHANKQGCFMYGNHFDDIVEQTENILLPKLVSLNSAHFDFGACTFSVRNMYAKDKANGSSKEGSGRVGIYKRTGIIHW